MALKEVMEISRSGSQEENAAEVKEDETGRMVEK